MIRTPLRRKGFLRRLSKRMRATIQAQADWRQAVLERDQHRCQIRGCDGAPLECHHVFPRRSYPSLRLVVENGITLCRTHHRGFHAAMKSHREKWKYDYPERWAAVQILLALSKGPRVV